MRAPRLSLKPGREKALLRRHPWVFSGAVARIDGEPAAGETVEILSADGRFLAWGACSPASQIVARAWSFDHTEPLSPALVRQLIERALRSRARHFPAAEAVRLLHAEADGLPGVICDRYADRLVLQLSSAGAVAWRETIVEALAELTGVRTVLERSEAEVMALEGLPPINAVLRGDPPPPAVRFREGDLQFLVPLASGQKTGFYLDQRDNRQLLRQHAAEAEVLDCFCYTGGFTLNALAGGARAVTAIDSSGPALALAREQLAGNNFPAARVEWVEDDVFKRLRRLRDQARSFDVVVLDPPKFAPTAALAERAARGYKDINLLALKLLKPGGLLFTFSCSGGVSRDLFQKIVAGAAVDAEIPAQFIRVLGAAADHPVALAFPEGDYLKGLLVQRPG